MIRTMGKLILVIMALILMPLLVFVVGPTVGIALSGIGAICVAFLPFILIGVAIGWISKKRH
jgi:hypothetical protein